MRQVRWSGIPISLSIFQSQNIRIVNVFLESLLSEPFPHWESQFISLSSNTVLISGPLWGAAQILIWSYPCMFLPPMSTAIRTRAFYLWELSMAFYIFHRLRVCLVDHVDLFCCLYSWWEVFGCSSLATLSLGFNCGFTYTSACGSSTGVCS